VRQGTGDFDVQECGRGELRATHCLSDRGNGLDDARGAGGMLVRGGRQFDCDGARRIPVHAPNSVITIEQRRHAESGAPVREPGRSPACDIREPDSVVQPAAFLAPTAAAGSMGNLGRAHDRPRLATWDLSFLKDTRFARGRPQFRAELFNLLNRANFNTPNAITFTPTGSLAQAGVITSTSTTSRQIQFGLSCFGSSRPGRNSYGRDANAVLAPTSRGLTDGWLSSALACAWSLQSPGIRDGEVMGTAVRTRGAGCFNSSCPLAPDLGTKLGLSPGCPNFWKARPCSRSEDCHRRGRRGRQTPGLRGFPHIADPPGRRGQ